eukprot:TRINITY_DN9044_c0_g1_i1.p1 TRINITY_DN9044_c0_g1~~TRINITY_DN9044_c0_g1_i1.p1  ORF type:complete len:2488 (+),score=602.33 TRINITY_DN9044_c0_g1_i1:1025-7465(+)
MPKVYVLRELLQCELSHAELIQHIEDAMPGNSLCIGDDPEVVEKFQKILVRLQVILEFALRSVTECALNEKLEYPPWGLLVEELAQTSFTVSLPMLKCHHKVAKKTMSTAAVGLEAVSSHRTQLRAALHFELALCEMLDDTLAKAQSNIEKAIAVNQASEFYEKRLKPLKHQIQLRVDIYSNSTNKSILDQAFLAVQQAREAAQRSANDAQSEGAGAAPRLVADYLQKAVTLLAKDQSLTKDRAALLYDVANLAWDNALRDLAQHTCTEWLSLKWEPQADAELGEMRVQLHFIQAYGLTDESIPENEAIRNERLSCLFKGIDVALAMKDDARAQNGVILVWNSLLPAVSTKQWSVVRVPLLECFRALARIQQRDVNLVGQLCTALVRALEDQHLQKGNKESSTASPHPSPAPLTAGDVPPSHKKGAEKERATTANSTAALQADLKVAEEVCKFALGVNLSQAHRKDTVALLTRIQKYKGIAPTKTADVRSQIVVMIENVTAETVEAKRKELVQKIYSTLESSQSNEVELFALVALEALAHKDYEMAQKITETAVSIAANIPPQDLAENARWYAVCLSVLGQSTMQPIQQEFSTNTASVSGQVQFILQSATHFANATDLAAGCNEKQLLEQNVGLFWNTCIMLATNRISRKILVGPIQTVLRACKRVKDTNYVMHVQLYRLMFDCMIDQRMFKEGLDTVEEALQCIPREYHSQLWEAKIIFLSGVESCKVSPATFTIKQNDSLLQAQVYTLLAQSSVNTQDQYNWYDRATKCLEGHPVHKAEVLLEFAGWCYCHNLPIAQPLTLLKEAGDIMLTLQEELCNCGVPTGPVPSTGNGMNSARSRITTISRVSRKVGSRKPRSHQPPHSGKPGSGGNSNNVDEPPTATALCPPAASAALKNLCVLFRVYAALARVAPREQRHPCGALLGALLLAHRCVLLAWEALLQAVADSSEAAPWAMPATLTDWALFCPSTRRVDVFRAALNTASVPQPLVLMWHLEYFVKMLCYCGLFNMCFPALALQELIAAACLDTTFPAYAVTHLVYNTLFRRCEVAETLGMQDVFKQVRAHITNIEIPDDARSKLAQELRQLEQLKKFVQTQSHGKSALATREKLPFNPSFVDHDLFSLQEQWTTLAKHLLYEGQLTSAKALLCDALFRANGFDDNNTKSWCLYLMGKIEFTENSPADGIALVSAAVEIGGDFELWSEGIASLVEMYVQGQQLVHAEDALTNGLTLIGLLLQQQPHCAVDCARAGGMLHLRLGEVLMLQLQILMEKLNVTEITAKAVAHMDEGVQLLRSTGETPAFVEGLLRNAQLLLELHQHSAPKHEKSTELLRAQAQLQEASDVCQAMFAQLASPPLSAALAHPMTQQLSRTKLMLARVEQFFADAEEEEERISGTHKQPTNPVELLFQSYEPPSTVSLCPPSHQSTFVLATVARTLAEHATGGLPSLRASIEVGTALTGSLASGQHVAATFSPTAQVDTVVKLVTPPAESCGQRQLLCAVGAAALHEAWELSVQGNDPAAALSEAATLARLMLDQRNHIRAAHYLLAAQNCQTALTVNQLLASLCNGQDTELLYLRLMDDLRKDRPAAQQLDAFKAGNEYLGDHSPLHPLREWGAPPHQTLKEVMAALPSTGIISLLRQAPESDVERDPFLVFMVWVPPQQEKHAELAPQVFTMTQSQRAWDSLIKALQLWHQKAQDAALSQPDIFQCALHLDDADKPLVESVPVVASLSGKSNIARSKKRHGQSSQALAPPAQQQQQHDGGSSSDGCVSTAATSASLSVIAAEAEADPEAESRAVFHALVDEMNAFFAPLTASFERPAGSKLSRVVLLLDEDFAPLPLEQLSFFHVPGAPLFVCRDFSLTFLRTRVARYSQSLGSSSSGANAGRPVKQADQKADKFTYIVDLENEGGSGPAEQTPSSKPPSASPLPVPPASFCAAFTSLFLAPSRKRAVPLAKGWEGILGSVHSPSIEEWQATLLNSAVLLYAGYGSLFSSLQPRYLSSLNLTGCVIALLGDLAVNGKSLRRKRQPELVGRDTPYTTALLLSLRGVGAVVLNQWGATAAHTLTLLAELVDLLATPPTASTPPRQIADALQSTRQALAAAAARSAQQQRPPGAAAPPAPPHSELTLCNTVLYGLPTCRLPKRRDAAPT